MHQCERCFTTNIIPKTDQAFYGKIDRSNQTSQLIFQDKSLFIKHCVGTLILTFKRRQLILMFNKKQRYNQFTALRKPCVVSGYFVAINEVAGYDTRLAQGSKLVVPLSYLRQLCLKLPRLLSTK